jgi:hypothetical protein
MAHKGIVIFSATQHQVRKIVIGKALESPPGSGTFIDKEALYGWYNDAGTIRRWARAAPDRLAANITTSLNTNPSDADPYFRVALPAAQYSGFTYSLTIVVIRTATGIAKGWTVSGTELSWASDGGGESYDVTLTLQLLTDTSLPSEFDDYQLPGNAIVGTTESYTDPREPI